MSATETTYNPRRHWLQTGWWEVRCTCCDMRVTVPNLFCLRALLHTAIPGIPYLVIRFRGMDHRFRERFLLSYVRHPGRKPECRRIQRKGG